MNKMMWLVINKRLLRHKNTDININVIFLCKKISNLIYIKFRPIISKSLLERKLLVHYYYSYVQIKDLIIKILNTIKTPIKIN